MPNSIGYYLSMYLTKLKNIIIPLPHQMNSLFWHASSDINNVFITAPNANMHLHVPHQMKCIIDMLH